MIMGFITKAKVVLNSSSYAVTNKGNFILKIQRHKGKCGHREVEIDFKEIQDISFLNAVRFRIMYDVQTEFSHINNILYLNIE